MSCLVNHEGGPWEGESAFAVFEREMMRQIANVTGLTRAELARLQGMKPCLSCGATQDPFDGSLPCGH